MAVVMPTGGTYSHQLAINTDNTADVTCTDLQMGCKWPAIDTADDAGMFKILDDAHHSYKSVHTYNVHTYIHTVQYMSTHIHNTVKYS